MEKNCDKDNIYLKVLPFGVCPECLEQCATGPTTDCGRTVHYHCVNPKCSAYMEDVAMPIEIFDVLYFLENHQPHSDLT